MSSAQSPLFRLSFFGRPTSAGGEAAWLRAREQGARAMPQMSARLDALAPGASPLSTRADLPLRSIAADLLSRA
jgi:hypothetical protein